MHNRIGRNKKASKRQQLTIQKVEKRQSNWITIVFTFVLTVFTGIQAWTQLTLSRANINVLAISLNGDRPKSGVPLIIRIKVKNSGLMNADLRQSEFTATTENLSDTPKYGTQGTTTGYIIPPNGEGLMTFPFSIGEIPFSLSGEQVENIYQNRKTLTIFGRFTYFDRVSDYIGPRHVGVCFHFDPSLTGVDGFFQNYQNMNYTYSR